ncbi:rifin, partial [Plasmodium reichenowi]
CGLGSVAGSVGLFGGIIINIWKPGALKAAIDKAIVAGTARIAAAANAAGDAAGKELVIAGLQSTFKISTLKGHPLKSFINPENYNNFTSIYEAVYEEYFEKCIPSSLGKRFFSLVDANLDIPICKSVFNQTSAASQPGQSISSIKVIETNVQTMVSEANGVAKAAAEIAEATERAKAIKTSTDAIEAASTQLYGAIGYSILAILIIVLIMIIIYLVLRYRRKKKMKKKAQYTKLLNQ